MYAIMIELDVKRLSQLYVGEFWIDAYTDIKTTLAAFGFDWQYGSVYISSGAVNSSVKCILAAQTLSKQYAWFKDSVRDIRMLRIDELSDLALLL